MTEKIILASGSPRRRELLAMLGVPFIIKTSDAEEVMTGTDPSEVTEELSRQKAEAVVADHMPCAETKGGSFIIIGADTVVSVDGRILGKPENREMAKEMISDLQGRSHMVYTGVTLLRIHDDEKEYVTFSEGTRVNVAPMSESEILSYIDTDEPYDKAGGYGIQGIFAKYIEGIEGDYFNVVGLPVHRLYEALKEMEVSCENWNL